VDDSIEALLYVCNDDQQLHQFSNTIECSRLLLLLLLLLYERVIICAGFYFG